MGPLFKSRVDAGHGLARLLKSYRGSTTLVLGLPRGGVVVAAEVARELGAELNAIVTRKIGAPGNPEFAIGAVADGGTVVLNEREIEKEGICRTWIDEEIQRQQEEIARRIALYRQGWPLPDLKNRLVLIVDDGVATGYTMLAALREVRARAGRPVVMVTPVIPRATFDRLALECDDTAVVALPDPFYAVGLFYEEFDQVSDEHVIRILRGAIIPHAA